MRTLAPSLLVCVLLAAPAAAQTPAPSADAMAEAKAHAHRATQLYDLGKYVDAAKEYEQSFALSDRAPLLFNIAQAYRLANLHKEATAAYRGFLRRMPESPLRAEAQRHIDEMDKADREADEKARLQKQADEQARAQREADERARAAAQQQQQPAAGHVDTPSSGGTSTGNPQLVTSGPPPRAKKPIYKQWWLWTAVGVVAAGAAVGIALAVTTSKPGQTNFPALSF